jgi:hypothetical protein
MRKKAMMNWKITAALLGMGLVCAPAFAANPARPGTVNYIEGSAYLDGQQLNNQNVGTAELDAGQVLSTAQGKAEVLLTPGIFLRLDDNSAVKMISPDLTNTQVEVAQGRASVEVDQIFAQNQVQIVDAGVTTQVMKPGYYEFDAARPEAMVFDGQAEAQLGANKWEEIKGHHELALTAVADGAREKTASFNTRNAQDDLYNWSSLRSQYLAEANNQIARGYMGAGFYPGWYWDPYGWDYTFIGMSPFMSPFGWGYYPWGGWGGWGYWGGFGRGFYGGYGRGIYGRGFEGGGFHGGEVAGGGFHGGGGGGRR